MMLGDLRLLLAATGEKASLSDLREAVLDDNVLGKASASARQRSFRYLRELYGLDARLPAFRALRRVWDLDVHAQPLVALSSALVRDPALRGTATAVLGANEGTHISAHELAEAVTETYPGSYSDAVAHKIGRNAASTWTQSGHLAGRVNKVRVRANPRPPSIVYALYLAHLDGLEGDLMFDSLVVQAQDAPTYALKELAREASRRGWLDFRSIGSVTEIGFEFLEREDVRA